MNNHPMTGNCFSKNDRQHRLIVQLAVNPAPALGDKDSPNDNVRENCLDAGCIKNPAGAPEPGQAFCRGSAFRFAGRL